MISVYLLLDLLYEWFWQNGFSSYLETEIETGVVR